MSHHWLLGWCFVCLAFGLACTPADDSSDDELADDDVTDDDLLDDDAAMDDDVFDDDVLDDDLVDDDAVDDDSADDDAIDDDTIDDDAADDDAVDDDVTDDDTADDDAADDDLIDDDAVDDDTMDDDTIDDDDTVAATFEVLDTAASETWVEGSVSLAFDPDDALHITYQRFNKYYSGGMEGYYRSLWYATNQSDGWLLELLGEGWYEYYPYHATSYNVGEESAVRADDGKARVVVHSQLEGGNQYHSCYTGYAQYLEPSPDYAIELGSSSCISYTHNLCPAADNGAGPSLAVDAAGGVHMTYQEYDSDWAFNLIYAYYDGSAWESTVLDDCPMWSKMATAVDVDDVGHVFVTYFCENQPYLVTNQTGDWVREPLPAVTTNTFSSYSALHAEGDGHLYVAYGQASNWESTLRVVERPDSATPWTEFELVDYNYWGLSLAVDPAGVAHLSYSDAAGLKYATNEAGAWTEYFVDDCDTASDTAIGVDSSGAVSIVYVRGNELVLAQIDGVE